MQYLKWLYILIFAFVLAQCAKLVPPTGGPIDQVAPRIVLTESTPNGLTNFKPDETEFTFDEYILLTNPDRNIIISPPLSPPPTFYLSGKTIIGDWSKVDSFRSNTTYTVNLGNAVEDLNEGNPLTDFVFAFSTGPVLDSLRWEIEVFGPDGKAAEGATVLLYKEFRDSVVSKQLPFYFAKTNAFGKAEFQFLKGGKYKVVALQDKNLTLTYDIATEAIGFIDSPVVLPADTGAIDQIRMFIQKAAPILARAPFYHQNKINFLFTEIDTHQNILPVNEEDILLRRWKSDSLQFWPAQNVSDSLVFKWAKEDSNEYFSISPIDSFQYIPFKVKEAVEFMGNTSQVVWNQPLSIPSDTVFYSLDSNQNKYFLKHEQISAATVRLKWQQDSLPPSGKIYIEPGMLQSPYNFSNKDTIPLNFRSFPASELGAYQLTFSNADPSEQYIVQLLQGGNVIQDKYFQNDSAYVWSLTNLKGGEYQLQLIKDSNGNRKQDGGNYWEKRQPELPVQYTLPKLRANWVIEEEIDIKNAVKGE